MYFLMGEGPFSILFYCDFTIFGGGIQGARIERQKKVGVQSGLYLPEEDISARAKQSAHSAMLSARIDGIEEMAEMKRFELLRR
ncbi:hypothetical protein [Acutalibacter sp. 1XD8-36]|uniref:hypothetical protein n=1 Tax=Acutalibacter sp. 1XD8-36 TaxID=2320852 RepID=UPI00141309D2|nr:hypothetical protein [Acutalibacter sp. 1XD8-36]NBJ90045.1 hypothetical protein [Acutalibacter sp. 1XD8-36]